MKKIQIILTVIILTTIFFAFKSSTDVTQLLSKPIERKEMMDSIANNNGMAKEMVEALMLSKPGAVIMLDKQKAMIADQDAAVKIILPAIKNNNLTANMAMVN